MSQDSVGMMDPAFFVGKNVLIKWINEFLETDIKKVEDMATGALYCQLLDAIYPGKVPLHKVNFHAKFDYDWLKNWKVLQDVFIQQGVTKFVDVQKLCKAKYQDNLEFLQWMKSFFDQKYSGQPYAAGERREQAVKKSGQKVPVPSKKEPIAPSSSNLATKKTGPIVKSKPTITSGSSTERKPAEEIVAKHGEISEENDTLSKLRLKIEGLEKEVNFYFGKLRLIEILCNTQDVKDSDLKQKILDILYRVDDEEEFQAPPQEMPQNPADSSNNPASLAPLAVDATTFPPPASELTNFP